MATLSKPVLKITVISGTSNAKVNVKGKLTLTAQEKSAIASGIVTPSLKIEIWGQDDNPDPDDKLFTLASAAPTDTLEFSYNTTISKAALNEDHSVFEGGPGDEIYAKAVFRFTSSIITPAPAISKTSDVISGKY